MTKQISSQTISPEPPFASLGDLIAAVDQCATDEEEMLAILESLFSSGRITIWSSDGGFYKEIRLSKSQEEDT